MKKIKIFKKISYAFLSTVLVTPAFLVISCKKKEVEKPRIDLDIKFSFAKYVNDFLAKENNLHDATLVEWTDGDTPKVTVDPDSDNPKTESIRIMAIDTPESFVKGKVITEYEKSWSNKSKHFANSQIPPGAKIKVYLTGDLSYQRQVGVIFYGKNFSQNYSVNILKNGFTLPLISANIEANLIDEQSLIYHLALPLLQAYENARFKKLGLYKLSSKDLKRAYGTHGLPSYPGLDKIAKYYKEKYITIPEEILDQSTQEQGN